MHTSEPSETRHIRVRDDLGMFKTRSEGSYVDAIERRLECVNDKSICSITDCMDILEMRCNSRGTGETLAFLLSASRLLRISGYWIPKPLDRFS